MNDVNDAQNDMRTAYCSGAPGAFSSGAVWLSAGVVALLASPVAGILTLIFGGTVIFPLSVVFCKVLGRSGRHQKSNPLAPLALEGTVWMLFSIPVAVGAAFHKQEWFFPAMLLVIAGRYVTFRTIYGLRVYWIFGATLATAAVALIMIDAPVFIGGVTGGLIEIVFALLSYRRQNTIKASEHCATRDAAV